VRSPTLLQEASSNLPWFVSYSASKWCTWNYNRLLELERFQVLKTVQSWFLGAVFVHVRHQISSWPLNKVYYPCQELQLLLRMHCHANTLDYSSTLVKVVLWKLKLWVNYDLEANLAHVMNTKIVLFTTLYLSKVFSWPHNHILHWSHMITSICMYIINITCDNM